LHYTFPVLAPSARVVTIHDTTYSLFPEVHTREKRIMMPLFTRMAVHHADGVLFISSSTRRDVEALFGKGNNTQVVTPLATDQPELDNVHPEDVQSALSSLGVRQPYILYIGTIEPRKNLVRLVEAFERVSEQHPDHTLVIAGRLGWKYSAILEAIERSPKRSHIKRLGYISYAEKLAMLQGCDALVYPSLYEGFGLPVLEGMAAGAPVVTGNSSCLPEVAGDGAVLVDVTSVRQIAEGIEAVLSNPGFRERLIQRGRRQASRFSWQRTAELTYAAYRQVVAKRSFSPDDGCGAVDVSKAPDGQEAAGGSRRVRDL
jgi:glycosyltransferase involved in cell wall biosynthesis